MRAVKIRNKRRYYSRPAVKREVVRMVAEVVR